MPTVRENLIAAKALIDSPAKWADWDRFSERRCIYEVALSLEQDREPVIGALRAECVKTVGHDRLSHFNDYPDTTHADIMALFDRAIAAQEQPND